MAKKPPMKPDAKKPSGSCGKLPNPAMQKACEAKKGKK